MNLIYALPLLIAFGFAWLALRHVLERRRERLFRERLIGHPRPARAPKRSDTERSQMRAAEDPTTAMRTLRKKPPSTSGQAPAADGTRTPANL